MNKLYEKIFKILIEYNIYQLPTAFQIEGLNKILAICGEQPKQITIEELRVQFEKPYIGDKEYYLEREQGYYTNRAIQAGWNGYKQCAIDCGILKQ